MKKIFKLCLCLITATFIISIFNACKPEPESQTPGSVKVTTSSVSNITETSAKCGGTVTASGYSVGNCGLCYSELPNPTINSYITSDQVGTGTFTSTMRGLEPGTKYYVRAYATTSSGTLYGEQKEFTTKGTNGGGDDNDDDNGGGNGGDDEEATKPTVTTNSVSNITFESATCGGNVTDGGGANVTARGVCWSTSQNPSINDNKTIDGNGIGGYVSNITGLNKSTTYYVRAYAINNEGTSYGEEKSFTTCDIVSEATGIIGGYEYVDMGLSVKWARHNIGALTPEDYGTYHIFGSPSNTTSHMDVDFMIDNGWWGGNVSISGGEFDTATKKWGSKWQMPSKEHFEELISSCKYEVVTYNNVMGMLFTSNKNSNTIFFPFAGEYWRYDGVWEEVNIGSMGYYHTGYLHSCHAIFVWSSITRITKSGEIEIHESDIFENKYPIRPVTFE